MPTKPTYPHSSRNLVPESCRNTLEPCCVDKPGCYAQHINHAFQLVINDLLETGTTRSPNAYLVLQDPQYNLWKIHWQRGNDAGPGHCIAVFQYINSHIPFQGHEDYLTHSCYSIPAPCQSDTILSDSSPSQSSESLTRRLQN